MHPYRGESTVKKNPGPANIVTGGKEEKRDAWKRSAIICCQKRRKEVGNCKMK